MRTQILFARIPSITRKFYWSGKCFEGNLQTRKNTYFYLYDLAVLEVNTKEQTRQNCCVMLTCSNLFIFISVSIVFFFHLLSLSLDLDFMKSTNYDPPSHVIKGTAWLTEALKRVSVSH
jgi:hypothetical protein